MEYISLRRATKCRSNDDSALCEVSQQHLRDNFCKSEFRTDSSTCLTRYVRLDASTFLSVRVNQCANLGSRWHRKVHWFGNGSGRSVRCHPIDHRSCLLCGLLPAKTQDIYCTVLAGVTTKTACFCRQSVQFSTAFLVPARFQFQTT